MTQLNQTAYTVVPEFSRFLISSVNSGSEGGNSTHTTQSVGSSSDITAAEEKSETNLISDLALILVVAGIATVLFKRLKQPVVLGYIVAGFLVGPHFGYFPTVIDEGNIHIWAELGVIFLLFSLGLEFSFKKLLNTGGSAAITALIIISGMMSVGFFAGKLMGFTFISSLFLGGMLSMSSTTIILKALTDLNLLHRRFTSQVLAVLIIEDLFAVILMVLLSSIAINKTVESEELMISVAKLAFFLILWFLIGVYVIPTYLQRQRKYLNSELLLVISIGLCFMMVMFSNYTGFSTALGAFVMGSILAGTCEAERISKVVAPIKDLFGAIFFISVGMMVDPEIIVNYSTPIIILSLVVIIGMIFFGTVGMLVTGQPLRIAIESGFSLTQIGEFSFIIATLGMALNVIDPNLYPIVVSVSVITTFFTPYFIKLSDPFSRWMEKKMPTRLKSLLDKYSAGTTHNENELVELWKQVTKRNLWRILLYSVLLIAIIIISTKALFPFMEESIGEDWGKLISTVITVIVMSPFLLALCYPSTKKWEREKLKSSVHSNMPFIAIRLIRVLLSLGFIIGFLLMIYSHVITIVIAIALFLFLIFYFSRSVKKHMKKIESIFFNNLNQRELRRSGKNNNLVSDKHLAYINLGYNCPFVGERLANSQLGKKFGINVVSIQRGEQAIAMPKSSTRIFPGDTIGVIGTDEEIQNLLEIIESSNAAVAGNDTERPNLEFTSAVLTAKCPWVGKKLSESEIRTRYSALIVAVEYPDGTFINPTADTVLNEGDNVWLVIDKKLLKDII